MRSGIPLCCYDYQSTCGAKNITFKSSYNWFKIDIHQQLRPLTANYLAMFKVTSTTIYTKYETQTKCKTRFNSQGMILNGFQKNHFSEQVCGTRDPLETPPLMANTILNFHFDYRHTSLTKFTKICQSAFVCFIHI